ncbi:hypothetical protein ACU80C_28835 (plasmid) [Bacillus mycoides]|uniref:Holin n=1 Tax=Bacillus mycoides TaxID=1405 RepID=A0AAP8GYU5_BACMY|nr:hypothetical protein [Bacillus mycoides]AJH17135.1 hypothetical protein BG05_5563 [Bacillus mycoides]EEL95936.1 hypothetical protein bmyco0001_56750 [Bacillus mycoides DSM 2048]EOO34663.1 hypothetical protein IKK_05468 [Bacillus mycoides]KMQ14699.1 hypothetical protein TU70_21725 [Bacillus mycoides]KUH41140.1 hypothetical protein M2E15_3178 [Bacillus mycoides]
MPLTKENILKRLRNWKTWVALFSCLGLILSVFGVTGFEGNLEKVQQSVYLFGIALGIWTSHGDDADQNEKGDVQ